MDELRAKSQNLQFLLIQSPHQEIIQQDNGVNNHVINNLLRK